MKIQEIVLYPSRIENIDKYQYALLKSQKSKAFGSLELSENITPDEHILGLFDKEKLASVLHLNIRDLGLWQITYTQTEKEFQGQGCFRYLLSTAVNNHNMVLSDDHQTTESKNAWKSLIKYPGPNLEIWVYDTFNHQKYTVDDYTDTDIWNNKTNPVLAATLKSNISNRNPIMDRLKGNMNIDRTDEGIWYGPNSSNKDYNNP